MKIALKRPKDSRRAATVWSACLPFVDNDRAVLIHRPKAVQSFKIHRLPHLGVHYWCNGMATGGKNFTFLALAPENKLVCQRCEDAAIESGLPSTDELCGAHRHKGTVVAVRTCHTQEPTP
jgi:hypothetical protein